MDDTAFSNAEAAPYPNGLYRLANGQILILPDADDLHLRICIVGHTGPAGYRGKTKPPRTQLLQCSSGAHSHRTSRSSVARAYTV
jgi:hypothetical protein